MIIEVLFAQKVISNYSVCAKMKYEIVSSKFFVANL